jgi:diaminopimelate epimerase
MHGCGNDFVVIDDRSGRWHDRREALAQEICDRRLGLGGDGLILIDTNAKDADFRMTYVNRTGVDGEMCGNGARCAVLRAAQLGLIDSGGIMSTEAGPIGATIQGTIVTLRMTRPTDERASQRIQIADQVFDCHYIDTGVPHVVAFLDGTAALEARDVEGLGRALRHYPAFAPRGVNANFATLLNDGSFRMRTYERGVERETLACGTGAVAVGLVAHRRLHSATPVVIHPTGGGRLEIGFRSASDGGFTDVTLTGPAETIAEGEIPASWLEAHGLRANASISAG